MDTRLWIITRWIRLAILVALLIFMIIQHNLLFSVVAVVLIIVTIRQLILVKDGKG